MTPFDDLCIDISPKTKKKTSHKQLYSNLKKYSHFADCVIIYSVYLYFSFGINLRDFLIFIIYRNIKTERGNDFVWHVYIYAFMLNNLQVASFSQIGYEGRELPTFLPCLACLVLSL